MIDEEKNTLDAEMNEPAATYPVTEDQRIGVSTDEGTKPVVTDQGDEANDAVIWHTPDDVQSDGDNLPIKDYSDDPIL